MKAPKVKTRQKQTSLEQLIRLVQHWRQEYPHGNREVRISRDEMTRFRELDGQIYALAIRLGLEIPKHRPLSQGSRRQIIGFTQIKALWDFNAWLACDREWFERMQGLHAALEAALLAQPEAAPADDERDWLARMLAAADDNTPRIIAIADRPGMRADEKLRAISAIDSRFYGKSGVELAALLNVTASAIRDTRWWKVDREKYIGGDERDRR